MAILNTLLTVDNCALILIDHQAGLAFGVKSMDPQMRINNTVTPVQTARAFGLHIIVSTPATKVYSGPLMAAFKSCFPSRSSSTART